MARLNGEEVAMGDITGLGYLGLTGSIQEWRPVAEILGLGYIGWEVGSRVREKLEAAAFKVEADPELARERGVLELFTCRDPSGTRLEFFFGAEVGAAPTYIDRDYLVRCPGEGRTHQPNCVDFPI